MIFNRGFLFLYKKLKHMEPHDEFRNFIIFVIKRLTRILFKIDRKKEFNEEEIILMEGIFNLYRKVYDKERDS